MTVRSILAYGEVVCVPPRVALGPAQGGRLSTSRSELGGARPATYRNQLLVEGRKQFHVRGYHATPVNEILDGAGVPKGSFYYHFGSKSGFGLMVLNDYMESHLKLFGSWASRDDLPIAERFGGYFDDLIRDFVRSDYSKLCLLGRFSSELAATDPSLRPEISKAYDRLLGAFVELLDAGIMRGDLPADLDIHQRAGSIVALTQGAFVVGLANRSVEYLAGVSGIVRQLATAEGVSPSVESSGQPSQGRRAPRRSDDALADENRQLRERVTELERVNKVLQSASTYFASQLEQNPR
jgi:TetR/AcrR family transcriptional regulator, transcriptional repressor for nem operon